MRKYVVAISLCLMFILSSCSGRPYKLRGGYVVTIDNDTIEFVGGNVTYESFDRREIRNIVLLTKDR